MVVCFHGNSKRLSYTLPGMSRLDPSLLLSPELAELAAYLPDLRSYQIRLDANEAPPLLDREVLSRLASVAGQAAWERYPDPTAQDLRRAIAARVGAPIEEIVVGAGSDELI
jgi:histidinol-phosphate aminotransferase